ncbi:hypothetical protein [Flaviflagellibacter deserti]|jgi:hypothetical protein|uniref:Uncharacterized protein n=1 Tax=Flaviflagellibacter deserti TaxID=2267266 RepID=A0ABV9Z4C7_9HYPH
MTDNSQYKRAKDPRKKQPVKRVALSDEAKRAYEELIQKRDERDKNYGVHLGTSERR